MEGLTESTFVRRKT